MRNGVYYRFKFLMPCFFLLSTYATGAKASSQVYKENEPEYNWLEAEYNFGGPLVALNNSKMFLFFSQGRFYFPLRVLGSKNQLYFEYANINADSLQQHLQTYSLGLRQFFYVHEIPEPGAHLRWFYTFSPVSFAMGNYKSFKPLLGPSQQDELGVYSFPQTGLVLLPKASVGLQFISSDYYGATCQLQTMFFQQSLFVSVIGTLNLRF